MFTYYIKHVVGMSHWTGSQHFGAVSGTMRSSVVEAAHSVAERRQSAEVHQLPKLAFTRRGCSLPSRAGCEWTGAGAGQDL